ncbi:MAG TPA: type II toxin-antitoxin system HicA family toxin [Nitrospirae bacterium]|nr:type II toxin-antitoxin system HicA family toxin [Nitrospirota bacterium]
MTPDKGIKILLRNGFELDHQTGSHIVYYNSATKRRAVVPYHRKDIPKGPLLSILKQAGIRDLF